MEDLSLHTAVPTFHWEDVISRICVVEAKIVTPRVKYIEIPACFLQEKVENSVIPEIMCTNRDYCL